MSSALCHMPACTTALAVSDRLHAQSKETLKHNLTATMMTYFLNLKYACLNGYQLIFYRLITEGCVHPRWGWRHPSYCKLCAIAEALAAGYEWVVYLDSDAFVRNATLPLPQLLLSYEATVEAQTRELQGIFFGWDYPYTLGPNAGFTALRNSAQTRSMLSFWWNVYAGRFSTDHSYEQHTLHWKLIHMHTFRRALQTLALRSMDPTYPHAVVHLDHNAGTRNRLWTMCLATVELLAPRGYPSLRDSLPMLRKKPKTLPYKLREQVLLAVVGAAADDMARLLNGSATPHNAPSAASNADTSSSASTVSSASNASTASASTSAPPLRCAPQLVEFDASAAAARHLQLAPLSAASLLGLPLSLSNCTAAPAMLPWQEWALVSTPDARPRRERNERRRAKGQEHRLSLRRFPQLCATLGETRSPRNPYASLAQLSWCDATPGSAAAARVALHYRDGSGELRTIKPLSELRSALPELATGCGFWPNCSGTQALRPKLCWAQISERLDACGITEPQMMNLMERQGRVAAIIGPAGPMAAAATGRNGDEHLCLGTWRGKLEEGNAAVFVRCPEAQPKHAKKRRWNGKETTQWAVDPSAGSSMHVRLVSKAAPHLCLSVPPIPV
uniref:Nucleotide-diphospho-sugar transferase domain-containing protein n=1 Tax=Chrysotila carterae TaxID=13221 RepID=A0A7S4BR63_CHRCT